MTLVDNHSDVLRTLKANIDTLQKALPHNPVLRAIKSSALGFVDKAPERHYDLVFLDPPYDHQSSTLTPLLVALVPHLAPGAWVMVERSIRSTPLQWPEALEVLSPKTYGETVVFVAEKS